MRKRLKKASYNPLSASASVKRDISLDYLRATVTLLVVVLHCSLPYTYLAKTWEPNIWISPVPIVDVRCSRSLDYLVAVLDASVMPLMFFISGLFTYPALRKKGALHFLKTRFYRLGLPFLGITLILMPMAYYVPWRLANPGGSLGRFLIVDAHAGFASGPGWFLWLLLFFDCVTASLYVVAGGLVSRLIPGLRRLGQLPWICALLLVLAAFACYAPLSSRYGDMWLPVFTMPFVLQPARALFYAVWLFAGFLAGSTGVNQGLLSEQGRLVQGWLGWLAVGIAGVNALWLGTRSTLLLTPLKRQVTLDLIWVAASVAICFSLIAIFRAKVHRRRAWADSIARHAYAIYAFHYIFALWIARALLWVPAPALVKFSLCLLATFALSWAAAVAWLRIWALSLRLFEGGSPPSSSEEHSAPLLGAAKHSVRRRA